MRKFNQKYLKSRNKGQILKLLIDKGPISRADISKELGVVRSTVSEITNELIELGLVNEGKKVAGKVGKRPTYW
jgi:Mn-dependent DtxR family transcriptional regulator